MTISAAQYTAWLADPAAIRCLLFEVGVNSGGVETTRYFSTVGFNSGPPGDTPPNTAYPAIASGDGLAITESISLDGSNQLTIGDIEVVNVGGERDSWFSDVWTNRRANVYLGDVRWSRNDFRLVFAGVVADIGSKDRSTINLILSNKLQLLNTAVTDTTLGGLVDFTQSGNVVTVHKVNHNRHVGSPVVVTAYVDGSSVTTIAKPGTYVITGAPDADHFTYSAPDTRLVDSGKLVLAGVNADSTIPVLMGECHNITPLLIDGTILRYQCHGGPTNWIFEVRDNGKPVLATVHEDTGCFELLASPAGAITASVQGDVGPAGYSNTVAGLVQRLVKGYGVAANRFTDADLDLTSLQAFEVTHEIPVGIFLTDRTNVLAAAQELAASIGAQAVVTRAGLLRLVQLNFPPTGTPTPIYQSSQIDRTLQIVARSSVQAAVKLNYVKNWTVQAGLQTAIPAEHKEMFASEWWSVTARDDSVAAQYKLTAEPTAVDTYLLTKEDALLEAARRLGIVKVPRTTYRFDGTYTHLELELGQAVTLYSNRFGLQNGALGVVTSLSPNWKNATVTVEVTV